MWKTITFLTILSSTAVLFTACSHKEPTVEERLKSQYGWKGTLPKPAADAEAGKEAPEQTPAPVIVSQEQKSPAPEQKAEPVKQETAKQEPVKQEPVKQEAAPAKPKEETPLVVKLTKDDLSGEKREHIIQKGESLWLLALREYGDGIYWRWIYEENTDVIKGNPSRVIPGMKIKIPLLKKKTPAADKPEDKKETTAKPAEKTPDKAPSK